MELSGTSFAAPVVAGTAAQILALHPSWTPDQVKGALMASAKPLPKDTVHAGGVGELDAVRSAFTRNPVNPNGPLEQFVSTDSSTGNVVFDGDAFAQLVSQNISWDTISWDTISWDTAAWNAISWDTISWDTISWDTISWDTISWDTISWDTISWDTISWDTISWDTISWDTVFAEDQLGSQAAANEGTADGYGADALGTATVNPGN
jgi:hypothetical protein